jgi:hypothetical protein
MEPAVLVTALRASNRPRRKLYELCRQVSACPQHDHLGFGRIRVANPV